MSKKKKNNTNDVNNLNSEEKKFLKNDINWLITIYLTPLSNPYK